TLKPDLFSKHAIEGVVRDIYGEPVKDIFVFAERTDTSFPGMGSAEPPVPLSTLTRGDGSFTLVVYKDTLYNLLIPLQKMEGPDRKPVWYEAETLRMIPPGSRPFITLNSWSNRVYVSIEGGAAQTRDPVWLETVDGIRMEAEKVVYENEPPHLRGPALITVSLFNVPQGTFKAVFLEDGARRFESALIDVDSIGDHHTRISVNH
ncbi:MAG: hypothetical protein ABIK28_02695, partial [Planctomycetota bacterium]